MKISVSGKQIEVGDAFRLHAEEMLGSVVDKYFGNALDARVVLSHHAHLYRADIAVHVGHNILVQSHSEADQPYPAFAEAAEHIAKRLRRYKRRLRDHHKRQSQAEAAMAAQQYILAADLNERDDDAVAEGDSAANDRPVVVAELTTAIDTLTVGEAVMRLDLADLPAMMFKNRAHGGLNMIYRRPDGSIGWVDPRGAEKQS